MLKPKQSELPSQDSSTNGAHLLRRKNFSTMDRGRSLAQVITEMRNEIKKLESENKALRGELGQPPPGREEPEQSLAFQHRTGAEETSSHASLRRNVSAPTLDGQYKENIIMTVRRYSISSNIITVNRKSETSTEAREDAESPEERDANWIRLQQENRGNTPALLENLARDESNGFNKDKLTNRRSLQEYVHKNRTKVKTVTFLLPVDDIYTNRPFFTNRLASPSAYDLDVIVEKDS
ncbi:hypothetical protein AAFF_G00131000 [Aldrovandia affinis]|uniref:Uncharacterized protein n=1 Tax=Aldrovandia affinis TaxID=143900 RepID=A0AAD7W9A7_9TELE|nr:hypothetical protein AAFF_G00131000 [Aldrovandia affinis]